MEPFGVLRERVQAPTSRAFKRCAEVSDDVSDEVPRLSS